MERRETFNKAAKIYHESRPDYPDEFIDWIIQRTEVSRDQTLLEIGAGSGQATFKFAERGYRIHCLEMGKDLAGILMAKNAGRYSITVEVIPFEEWEPTKPCKISFILSATAFHWLDKKIKYRRCHELLEDNGYLVLLWNVSPEIQIEEVKKAYELLWEYYPKGKKLDEDIKEKRKLEIVNSKLFVLQDYLDFKWKLVETREKFVKGFFSQSSYLALDQYKQNKLQEKVMELFKNLHEELQADFSTTTYIARKVQLI